MQTDPIWHRDSIGSLKPMQESSRGADPMARTYVYTCLCTQETIWSTFAPSWSGIGQVARPTFSGISGRVTELRTVDDGAVPASAPATSRLFVLPVAARRWVSTNNNCKIFNFPHWFYNFRSPTTFSGRKTPKSGRKMSKAVFRWREKWCEKSHHTL